MNAPQIKGSVITNQAESHVSLASVYIDFSLVKVQPPSEYQAVGQSLSARRRTEADEGQSHLTAAQLGILFGGIAPKAPNLVRAYGLRCSEIADSPTFNPKGTSQHGLFANEVGADGTAVWAAATSGDSAIAVHLLGCMLSCMWDPPEAISIWVQLIAERKQALATSGNPMEYELSRKISVTREQIASWHTSIQAWRRTADEANARRQHQLLLIINNLGIAVNSKLSLSDSVIEAWMTAMNTVDKLVAGTPQSVQTGAPLLGLSAWHLYPDMIIYGQGRSPGATEVPQNDPQIERGGVLTLGIQDRRQSSDGIYWSLPLAYLRYYGQPVHAEGRLSARTSRASFGELHYVALGSLIRRWLADADDIEYAANLIVKLGSFIDISGNLHKEGSWMSLIAKTANSFLTADEEAKAAKLQLIKCGRRRYPLFMDDPAAGSIFGLSAPSTLLRLLPGTAARVTLLRHVASDFSDHRNLMIIQCRSTSPESYYELASATQLASLRKRSHHDPSQAPSTPPKRYVRWLNRLHVDREQQDLQPDSDTIRLNVPIPCFHAPHGYQWQGPPQSFYSPLLEAECDDSDWRNARGVTVRSVLAFGDPDMAALYCVSIHFWTAATPNITPRLVGGPRYRELPNIFVVRHVLWAIEERLPSREFLFEYLEKGTFSAKLSTCLRALQTASSLYEKLHNATVELRAAERPLSEHQWIPPKARRHRHYPFAGFSLRREQMFACISVFESGNFNFHSSAMKGVLAVSSGNSIYVASCLLQDPCARESSSAVERVVGNLGKPGMVLLVCPAVPQVRDLSDDIRLVNHHPFDGKEENSFGETSLHLSFTEWQLPIDVGSRGNRDVEACYVEAAVGVYDKGKWVADIDILDVFNHPLSRIIPHCTQHRAQPTPIDQTSKLVTIDSWEELLDCPTETAVVRARSNWQARLAAAALAIQRGHETRIIPEKTCWSCCLDLKAVAFLDTTKDENTLAHDEVFGTIPWVSDSEASDSETDDVVAASARQSGSNARADDYGSKAHRRKGDFRDRNVIYIL